MTVGAGTATTRTDTILDRIVADKRVELEETRRRTPLAQLEARIAGLPAALPFAGRLRGTRLQLIAEIKKASPAKGLLEADLDPVARATTYAAGGAAAISVLTESSYFQGSLDHLAAVRASFEAAPARPALLRKTSSSTPTRSTRRAPPARTRCC
jgi:indole-3-glycerol phosphate synthase